MLRSSDKLNSLIEDTRVIREAQHKWFSRRVGRPFACGVTTMGLNYVDTRPIYDNSNTIFLSRDKEARTPLSDDVERLAFHTEDSNLISPIETPTPLTIVLTHGYSMGLGAWTENFDRISCLPGVNRVVAFDWRGMAGSDRLDDGPVRSVLTLLDSAAYNPRTGKPYYPSLPDIDYDSGDIKPYDDNGEGDIPSSLSLTNWTSTSTALTESMRRLFNHTHIIRKAIQRTYTPQRAVSYFIDPLVMAWDELHLDEQPVIMISHSLGGYLSAHFVHQYPGLVQRLVLASPVGVCESYGTTAFPPSPAQQLKILGKTQPKSDSTRSSSIISGQDEQSESSLIPPPTPEQITALNNDTYLPPQMAAPPPGSDGPQNHDKPVIDTSSPFAKAIRYTLFNTAEILWRTGSTPQSLLRLWPSRIGDTISEAMSHRVHTNSVLEGEDNALLVDYLKSLLHAPPCGENALNSLLCTDYPYRRIVPEHDYATTRYTIQSQIGKIAQLRYQQQQQQNNSNSIKKGSKKLVDCDTSVIPVFNERPDNMAAFHGLHNALYAERGPHTVSPTPQIQKIPRIFARQSLAEILYDIKTPLHFVYGEDDWLYQYDVPAIVEDLYYNTLQYKTRLYNKILRIGTPNSKESQATSPVSQLSTTTTTSTSNILQDIKHDSLLGLIPDIDLTILPDAGHHLHVNNIDAFTNSIISTIKQYNIHYINNYNNYNSGYNYKLSHDTLSKYKSMAYNNIVNDEKMKNDNKCSKHGFKDWASTWYTYTRDKVKNIVTAAAAPFRPPQQQQQQQHKDVVLHSINKHELLLQSQSIWDKLNVNKPLFNDMPINNTMSSISIQSESNQYPQRTGHNLLSRYRQHK